MIQSVKHSLLPLMVLLVACGQGESTQAAAPTNASMVTATPVETGQPVSSGVQMAQMDHSMHGGNHSMDMPTHGRLEPAVSQNGLFKATVTSEVEPILINRLHSWTLSLTTADGAPVEDASIIVNGTMPAHAHGMPTQPQVTANLGGGRYKVEGMQFQMGGEWEVSFVVTAGTSTDTVVFHLTLQ